MLNYKFIVIIITFSTLANFQVCPQQRGVEKSNVPLGKQLSLNKPNLFNSSKIDIGTSLSNNNVKIITITTKSFYANRTYTSSFDYRRSVLLRKLQREENLENFLRRRREIAFNNISVVSTRNKKNWNLAFPELPIGNVMMVSNLNLKKENFLFEFFSQIMGYLQLGSFPLELLNDLIRMQLPHQILIWKAIKFEIPMLSWIFIWLTFALALPFGLFAIFCCKSNNKKESKRMENNWKNVLTTIFAYFIMKLILSCVVLMLATNEQISKSASMSPEATKIIFRDVENFIKNTKSEFTSVILSSIEIGINATHEDLDGVEMLLGKPLMNTLDVLTGFQNTTLKLNNLKIATEEISLRVSDLLKDCDEARKVGKSLEKNLIELFRLLTLARQKCLPRDQALCDTLQISSLNVSFRVDELLQDTNLQVLKGLKNDEEFDNALNSVTQTYRGLSRIVSLETVVPRAEIKNVLATHENEIHEEVFKFENKTNSLLENITINADRIYNIVKDVTEKDVWRWLVVLILSSLIFIVWSLLLCGMPCGCDLNSRMTRTLSTGLGLTSILILLIWSAGSLGYLVGTHGTLICKQLYDEPKFEILDYFVNDKIEINVEDSLRNCKINRPIKFQTDFNLDQLNHNQWNDLTETFPKFYFNLTLDFVSPTLENYFNKLTNVLQLNMTEYRLQTSKTITNHDLPLLAQQIERVGQRLKNYRNVIEMDILAKKTRRLELDEVQVLNKYRDRIFYKIAEIEIMMELYVKQIKQTLHEMDEIQDFVESGKWDEVVQKIIQDYILKLQQNLFEVEDYIKEQMDSEIGKCKPLWDSFDAARTIICKMMVDPMNGFTLACFVCILLFLSLAPLIIQIVVQYKIMEEDSFNSITHRRARNGSLIDDEGTWVTPSPTRSKSNRNEPINQPPSRASWNVSQYSPEPLIPEPPRFPQRSESVRSTISISPMLTTLHAARILNPSKLLFKRISESPTESIQRPFHTGPSASRPTWDRYESLKSIKRAKQSRTWL